MQTHLGCPFHAAVSFLLYSFFLQFYYRFCLKANLSYLLAFHSSLWVSAFDRYHNPLSQAQMDRTHVISAIHNRFVQLFASLLSSSQPTLIFHQLISKHSFSFVPLIFFVLLRPMKTNLKEYSTFFSDEYFQSPTAISKTHYQRYDFLAHVYHIRLKQFWVCHFNFCELIFQFWDFLPI